MLAPLDTTSAEAAGLTLDSEISDSEDSDTALSTKLPISPQYSPFTQREDAYMRQLDLLLTVHANPRNDILIITPAQVIDEIHSLVVEHIETGFPSNHIGRVRRLTAQDATDLPSDNIESFLGAPEYGRPFNKIVCLGLPTLTLADNENW